MSEVRVETDSLGAISVPASAYWGAQTQRSIQNFPFGTQEVMPIGIIHALAIVKLAAARVNLTHGLDVTIADSIEVAAAEIIASQHDDQFPLVIWQTGSGTQSNMNVNEVIAGRANELLVGLRGGRSPVHPNDHVNMSQSSNDSFPTALHIAVALNLTAKLFPAIDRLYDALQQKAHMWSHLIKIGRTHLQDATPLTLGQEFSGYARQLGRSRNRIELALNEEIFWLAQGGTAVGTGVNAPEGFGVEIAAEIASLTAMPFRTAENKFEALASNDPLVQLSGALNTLAVALNKIANDIRLLASGPRCGFGELMLTANEPGSSIMPGKVNPTQSEMLAMVCAQVIGNHQAITIGGMQGHLELNTFKPMIGAAVLRSIHLLAVGMESFAERCIEGLVANERHIAALVERSLMLVTALVPEIGYDNAAKIAKHAHDKGLTLRESAFELELISAELFDQLVKPENMV
jgi:fumarate hydratase, class II